MHHKYAVNQMVDLVPAYNRPSGPCRIIQRVPYEGRRLQYRVQSLTEKNQRIVNEEDLRPSSSLPDTAAVEAAAHFSPIPVVRR